MSAEEAVFAVGDRVIVAVDTHCEWYFEGRITSIGHRHKHFGHVYGVCVETARGLRMFCRYHSELEAVK